METLIVLASDSVQAQPKGLCSSSHVLVEKLRMQIYYANITNAADLVISSFGYWPAGHKGRRIVSHKLPHRTVACCRLFIHSISHWRATSPPPLPTTSTSPALPSMWLGVVATTLVLPAVGLEWKTQAAESHIAGHDLDFRALDSDNDLKLSVAECRTIFDVSSVCTTLP